MRALPWVMAGVGFCAAAAYVIANTAQPRYATGSVTPGDAAASTNVWGTTQRIRSTGWKLLGKAKEGIGRAAGDEDLAGQGLADQAVGTVQNSLGQVAQAASDTIHQLNR